MTISSVRSIRVERLDQLAAGARVEVRARLVEHEQARVHRQHGGDRDPPPLAEAELVRRAVGVLAHAHGVQRASCTRSSTSGLESPRLSGPNATSSRTVGMNSWSSGSWKIRPTRARRSRDVVVADAQAGDLELARVPCQQRVEVQHQRRLAGAVGAEDGDALAVARCAGRARRGRGRRWGSRSAGRGRGWRSSYERLGSASRGWRGRRAKSASARRKASDVQARHVLVASRGRASPGARARRARRCAGTARWRRGRSPATCSAWRGA